MKKSLILGKKFITDISTRRVENNLPKRHHVVEGVGANAGPGKDSLSKIYCCILAPKNSQVIAKCSNNLVLTQALLDTV